MRSMKTSNTTSSKTDKPAATTGGGSGSSIVALMTALMAAVFAFQLNASMLSPALTTMGTELNASSSSIGLTQTVFFTSCAVFSLFLPRLGDLAGRKKVLLGMLSLTALGCVVSALAPNVTMLMIGRVIQGVAGPVVPMTLIMLHAEVTDEARYAKLMAVLGGQRRHWRRGCHPRRLAGRHLWLPLGLLVHGGHRRDCRTPGGPLRP